MSLKDAKDLIDDIITEFGHLETVRLGMDRIKDIQEALNSIDLYSKTLENQIEFPIDKTLLEEFVKYIKQDFLPNKYNDISDMNIISLFILSYIGMIKAKYKILTTNEEE